MGEPHNKEQALRNHIIIDGIAGHLFPVTEALKLEKVQDMAQQQIPQIPKEYIEGRKIPQFFDVKLADGKTQKYEVVHSAVKSNGFKALAYREVELNAPHEPVMDKNGKTYPLRFSFQGLVEGAGDYITAAKLYAGRNATHTESAREFTEKVIDKIGAKNISALIAGSHSYGAINAIEAYQVAKEKGVEKVEMVFLETYGAKDALQDFARKQADQQLRQKGKPYSKDVHDALAQRIFKDIAEHTVTINSSPASFVTRPVFRHNVGNPVGETYILDVTGVSHTNKKGAERSQTAVDRHRLTTMMQAVYLGAKPEYIGSFNDMGRGLGR